MLVALQSGLAGEDGAAAKVRRRHLRRGGAGRLWRRASRRSAKSSRSRETNSPLRDDHRDRPRRRRATSRGPGTRWRIATSSGCQPRGAQRRRRRSRRRPTSVQFSSGFSGPRVRRSACVCSCRCRHPGPSGTGERRAGRGGCDRGTGRCGFRRSTSRRWSSRLTKELTAEFIAQAEAMNLTQREANAMLVATGAASGITTETAEALHPLSKRNRVYRASLRCHHHHRHLGQSMGAAGDAIDDLAGDAGLSADWTNWPTRPSTWRRPRPSPPMPRSRSARPSGD